METYFVTYCEIGGFYQFQKDTMGSLATIFKVIRYVHIRRFVLELA